VDLRLIVFLVVVVVALWEIYDFNRVVPVNEIDA
jgi:hypothetical protein